MSAFIQLDSNIRSSLTLEKTATKPCKWLMCMVWLTFCKNIHPSEFGGLEMPLKETILTQNRLRSPCPWTCLLSTVLVLYVPRWNNYHSNYLRSVKIGHTFVGSHPKKSNHFKVWSKTKNIIYVLNLSRIYNYDLIHLHSFFYPT